MNFKTRILAKNVSYEHLADYLTADHGMDLAVWADGSVQLIEHNRGWLHDSDEAPVARVQCPGIGNLDSTYFTDDFAEYDDEIGEYTEVETGRKIGDLESVIRECCMNGDMTGYMDGLVDALNESAKL